MQIIDTTAKLDKLCADLKEDVYITVDTEFMRERTYWPELCLIQIAGARHEAIVDPLAGGIDLQPFFDLMADNSVLKVFHAARQDLEIIFQLGRVIPQPMFDTQIAAMVCGFGDQIGYEALVNKLARGQVDKSSRFTDWARRPLSDKQLAYALSDVTHLRVIYEKLRRMLDKSGREPWLAEELGILCSPSTYQIDPAEAWQRVKFRARNKRQVGVLMKVAEWREQEAQRRNVPRNWIVKDDAMTELAVQQPSNRDALTRLRALAKGHANSATGEALLAAVKQGLALDQNSIPDLPDGKPPVPEGTSAVADVLKLALKIIAEREDIAPKLIASSSDIEKIAAGNDDVPAMRGWRRHVFGEIALKIKDGELGLGLKGRQPTIFPLRDDVTSLKAAE
jgi:ribonuclease D